MFWLFCSIRKTVIQTFWMLIRTCGSCLLSVCCPVCGAALVLSDHWMMTWSLRLRKAQGNQILNCYITAHSECIQNVIQILFENYSCSSFLFIITIGQCKKSHFDVLLYLHPRKSLYFPPELCKQSKQKHNMLSALEIYLMKKVSAS